MSVIFRCEKIDPNEVQKTILDNGEVCLEPVKVDYRNGIGVMFLEEHTHEDILRYLINDMGLEDMIDCAKRMSK
jgi:hypothetical protein